MDLQHVRGVALLAAGVAALLLGTAFYFFIVGIFELPAATIALTAFLILAVTVWCRRDGAPTRGGA